VRGGWAARLHRRTPLRIRLVAALLGLVAIALAVTSATALSVLRGYLVGRVDSQLERLGHFGRDPFGPGGGDVEHSISIVFQVESATGHPLVALPRTQGRNTDLPELPAITSSRAATLSGHPFTVASTTGAASWQVLVSPLPPAEGAGSLVVAESLGQVDSTVSHLLLIDVIVSLAVLALLAGVGYLVVRSSLRPLVEVEETAEAIAAGDLSRRVPDRDPNTEVGRLARALNGMLAQIELAFHAREASERAARASEDRMRRFVADASHELRTPLTSIRGFAELYRQGAARDRPAVERAMSRIEGEATRMGVLVDDLLLLARLDQQRPMERRPVDLLVLAADAVHDARAVDPGRAITLVSLPSDAPPLVAGDEARLRQVVGNLTTNALTHTPPGASIELRIGADGGTARLEVSDTGPGLAPEVVARVFERFYRADAARPRFSGGGGLGLSIVSALVAAHGGEVSVESSPGHGAPFRVLLPLLASAPPGGEAGPPDRPGAVAGAPRLRE
jgi:two-component system OmpR family sensor kinase